MQESPTPKALLDLLHDTKSVSLEDNGKGLCLKVETIHSCLLVSLFGGHVLSFMKKCDQKELLWLSESAIFDGKTPIRGGIPICWPWFSSHHSEPNFPNHGFARTQMFELLSIEETFTEQEVSKTQLILRPSQLALYGYANLDMKLLIDISDSLNINIISMNNSNSSIALTQALHTYLRIEDIASTLLKGLTTDYADKPTSTLGNKSPEIYTFKGEVDRIHSHQHRDYTQAQTLEVLSTKNIALNSQSSHTTIHQCGHDSTVVWNPGKEKSTSMKDMDDEGFLTMLCIEAANTQHADIPLHLQAGQIHKLSQTIY